MDNRYGIATVTDENYIRGTEALLYSFLKNNPWFKGDIVIIHDQLQNSCKRRLRYFPNTYFVQIDEVLKESISLLINEIPELEDRCKRFYKLQVFNLTEYDKILFLDSDIICKGDVMTFFQNQTLLKVCPDTGYNKSKVRDKKTFELVDERTSITADTIKITFNSGMMLIGREYLNEKVFNELTGLINSKKFMEIKSGHTDQVILNQYFHNKFDLVENIFNYLLIHKSTNYNKALLLHFIKWPKPWCLRQIVKRHFLRGKTYPGFIIWYKTYLGYLIQREKILIE